MPDQILTQIKQATEYQLNKKILHEKVQTDLHVTHNGGLFKVTPELIGFLNAWLPQDGLFLTDVYDNPIRVDRDEFLKLCKQHYTMVMNAWHIEHEKLKRARKI